MSYRKKKHYLQNMHLSHPDVGKMVVALVDQEHLRRAIEGEKLYRDMILSQYRSASNTPGYVELGWVGFTYYPTNDEPRVLEY